MTMLVMLLLGQVYMDLDEVDGDGGVNSAIPIGANIGDGHLGDAPAGLVYIDLYEADDVGGGNSAIPNAANIGDDHVGYNAVFMLIMGLQEVVYRANCNWID